MKKSFLLTLVVMLLLATNTFANATEERWLEEANKACHDINISRYIALSKEATAFFPFL